MAAVSLYPNGSGVYSPHGIRNGRGSPWDFSAPVDAETTPSRSQRPSVNETPPPERQQFDPLPPARTPDRNVQHGANGMKSAADIDPSYLSPYRNGVRPALSGSRSGSEADSLIDLYGRPRSIGEGSVGIAADRDRPIPPEELYLNDEDPERSRWIHRDKLALIESHEMREAGIKLPQQQTRLTSKSKLLSESVQSHGVPVFLSQEAEELPTTEREQRRTRSPTRPYEDGHETLVNEFDLRTPEEIAADNDMDRNPSNSYRQQDLRKTSSRIPLPRSSPLPIPQGHIERDTPLPRKRGVSGTWAGEENGISYNRIRSRGNSVGSQVLLDDPDASYYTPTHASRPGTGDSPNTTRVISNKPTSTHSRKTSLTTNAPTIHQKPRQSSVTASPRTPSSTQRPKSRSGLEPRPPTAINRPEGDAPWLATMYKPDPRLPPDQQILPTHAKRLQQEQWERARKESEQRRLDGKASPQLPREFSPLAEHTVHGLQPSSSRDAEEDEKVLQERGSEWPLTVPSPNPHKSIPSPTPPAPDEGPHTSAAGAYSPIPHARVKKGESPVPPHPPVVVDPFVKERLARADEEKRGHGTGTGGKGEEEEGKKEKGCGCCSVM